MFCVLLWRMPCQCTFVVVFISFITVTWLVSAALCRSPVAFGSGVGAPKTFGPSTPALASRERAAALATNIASRERCRTRGAARAWAGSTHPNRRVRREDESRSWPRAVHEDLGLVQARHRHAADDKRSLVKGGDLCGGIVCARTKRRALTKAVVLERLVARLRGQQDDGCGQPAIHALVPHLRRRSQAQTHLTLRDRQTEGDNATRQFASARRASRARAAAAAARARPCRYITFASQLLRPGKVPLLPASGPSGR